MAKSSIRLGLIRPTYIFRDPRDALLSAIEYGQRARQLGHSNAFSHLVDFDTALSFMQDYIGIWEAWMDCNQALHSRYEDLLTNYNREVHRLIEFLPVKLDDPALQNVIDHYRPRSESRDQKGLHFRVGKIGRFREKLSPEHEETVTQAFKPFLDRMGYAI
jgi:hypothetical protein